MKQAAQFFWEPSFFFLSSQSQSPILRSQTHDEVYKKQVVHNVMKYYVVTGRLHFSREIDYLLLHIHFYFLQGIDSDEDDEEVEGEQV